jgi:hypothetical protein
MARYTVYFENTATYRERGAVEVNASSETEAYLKALGRGPSRIIDRKLIDGVSRVVDAIAQA